MVVVYNPQSTTAENIQPTVTFENPQPGDVLIWHWNPRPFAWNSCWIFRVSYQALKCPTSQKESYIIYGLCNVIWYDDDQSAAIWVSWSVLTFSGFISNSSHKILNLIWHVLAMIEIAVKSLPWNPNKREQVLRSRGRSNRFCSSLIWPEKNSSRLLP